MIRRYQFEMAPPLSREEKIRAGKERLNAFRSMRMPDHRPALGDISNVGKADVAKDTPKKSARPQAPYQWAACASPQLAVTKVSLPRYLQLLSFRAFSIHQDAGY